jgi:hypothetical protein
MPKRSRSAGQLSTSRVEDKTVPAAESFSGLPENPNFLFLTVLALLFFSQSSDLVLEPKTHLDSSGDRCECADRGAGGSARKV